MTTRVLFYGSLGILSLTATALVVYGFGLMTLGISAEREGYEYGTTLDPLPGAPLLDGTSGGQRGSCAARAVLTYPPGSEQDAFMKGCLDGARRA
jgi:hypothetical protein